MPAAAPPISPAAARLLRSLGQRLRAHRKRLGVSATATAEAAGMSRQTLFRIEKGEASVAMGAWLSAAAAVGLQLELADPARKVAASKPPPSIRPADYPQLKKLAWQLDAEARLTPKEALDLYERNWRHVDTAALDEGERRLLDALAQAFGRERLVV